MTTKIYLLLFMLLGVQVANSQEDIATNRWYVQANLQHQDMAFEIPYGQLGVVHDVHIRPFYNAEIQYLLSQTSKKKRYLTGQLGYYNNLYHNQALSLKLGYAREYKLFKIIIVNIRGDVGIAAVKNSDVQYVYEEGKWVAAPNYDPTRLAFLISPHLDLGYRIRENKNPIDLFLTSHLLLINDYEWGALPYYGIGVGVRYGL